MLGGSNVNELENKETQAYLNILPVEIRNKFLKVQKDKYKVDKEYANTIHNDISILIHYGDREDFGINDIYTILAEYTINKFTIKLLKIYNKYLSQKYKIHNLDLQDIAYKDNINEFRDKLKSIDEEWMKWFYLEFFKEYKSIINGLRVRSIDEVIRINKIGENILKDINKRDNSDNDEYLMYLFQAIYEFSDKLKVNDFVNKQNILFKELYNLYSDKDWQPDGNKFINEFHQTAKIKGCKMNIESTCKIFAYQDVCSDTTYVCECDSRPEYDIKITSGKTLGDRNE